MGSNSPSGAQIYWGGGKEKKMFFLFLFCNKCMLDNKSHSADENNALIIQVRKISTLDFTTNLQSNLSLPFAVKLRFLMGFVLVGSPQYAVVLLRLLSRTRQNTVMLVVNFKCFLRALYLKC